MHAMYYGTVTFLYSIFILLCSVQIIWHLNIMLLACCYVESVSFIEARSEPGLTVTNKQLDVETSVEGQTLYSIYFQKCCFGKKLILAHF